MPDRLPLDEIYPIIDKLYKDDDPDTVRKTLRHTATECGLRPAVRQLDKSLRPHGGELTALKILAAVGLWLEAQEAR